MDYSTVIELDNIRLDDCLDLYEKKGMNIIINDGRIINLEKEEKKENNNYGYKSKKNKRKRNYSHKRK